MNLHEVGELHGLLHMKWSRDVGKEGYSKTDWGRFEELLGKAICDAIGCSCGGYLEHYRLYQRCSKSPLVPPLDMLLEDMCSGGWMVAVHNDYRQDGETFTFWLFTHAKTGVFVKGEGRTDQEAVAKASEQASSIAKLAETMNYGNPT